MKNNILKIKHLIITIMTLVSVNAVAQEDIEKYGLTTITEQVEVNSSPEHAWKILASYGDVGSFLQAIESSKSLNGSQNQASLGCDRQCDIASSGKKKQIIKEKIVEIENGNFYRYEVYDWVNLPIKKMFITFGVKQSTNGNTVIYQKSDYKLKNGLMTAMSKGKFRSNMRLTLLGYKHYMETGERNVDAKTLKKRYKNS